MEIKELIFQNLKQEYASLGLGNEILQAQADALASLGFVTEDNVKDVIKSQKGFLEGLQKANDKRVTDAIAKVKKEHDDAETKKAAELEAQRKLDEERIAAEKKAKEEAEALKAAELEAAKKSGFEKEFAQYKIEAEKSRKELEKKILEILSQNKAVKAEADALKTELAQARASEAEKMRSEMILSKARELGISQTRIDEGFVISKEANEAEINEYLGKVATNEKSRQLPPDGTKFTLSSSVDKSQIDSVADSLVH